MPRSSRRVKGTGDLSPSDLKFKFIMSRPFDTKNRVTLTKVLSHLEHLGDFESFNVYVNDEGLILLEPMSQIPANEKWAWENKEVRESFEMASKDVMEGRVVQVDDLDSFLGSL